MKGMRPQSTRPTSLSSPRRSWRYRLAHFTVRFVLAIGLLGFGYKQLDPHLPEAWRSQTVWSAAWEGVSDGVGSSVSAVVSKVAQIFGRSEAPADSSDVSTESIGSSESEVPAETSTETSQAAQASETAQTPTTPTIEDIPPTPPTQPKPTPPAIKPLSKQEHAKLLNTTMPSVLQSVRFSAPPRHHSKWYTLGMRLRDEQNHRKAAAAFMQAAKSGVAASYWRAAADELVKVNAYAEASQSYQKAVELYRNKGDDMTARALEHLALPYHQAAEPFLVVPKKAAAMSGTSPLARFEPPRGVLLGMYATGNGVQGFGTRLTVAEALKPYAVSFRYWKFSRSQDPAKIFPGRFARAVQNSKKAMHLALEPGMPLREITDDIVLAFAREAKKFQVPIFVRFASEMNDTQNAWSRDPKLYRETFRRVAKILRREAPNISMVWMPMPGDVAKMETYYPGPEAVDWVGLSLYSVPFENGDKRKPRLTSHPLGQIDAFYRRYAAHHPVQISEYASSHHSGAEPKRDFSQFAAQQMREVYWGAWLKYPRLKNINWLELNMHTEAVGRKVTERLNDYRLEVNPAKVRAMQAIQSAFFGDFEKSQCQTCTVSTPIRWPKQLTPDLAGQVSQGMLWVQAATLGYKVKLLLNGKEVPITQTLPHRFEVGPFETGHHLLTFKVFSATKTTKTLLFQEHWPFVVRRS